QTQEYEERSASELTNDLHDEGFPKANVSRLNAELARSRFTIRGRRRGTFQIDVRRLADLEEKFADLLTVKKVEVSDTVLPSTLVQGTRVYLENMVHQINGCYQY